MSTTSKRHQQWLWFSCALTLCARQISVLQSTQFIIIIIIQISYGAAQLKLSAPYNNAGCIKYEIKLNVRTLAINVCNNNRHDSYARASIYLHAGPQDSIVSSTDRYKIWHSSYANQKHNKLQNQNQTTSAAACITACAVSQLCDVYFTKLLVRNS